MNSESNPFGNSGEPGHKRVRRPRYRGTHPRSYAEKYKEHHLEAYPEMEAHLRAKGNTPAGAHVPILVEEVLECLAPKPGEIVLDCTIGYGGHAWEFLKRIAPDGRLIGLDVDGVELERTRQRLSGGDVPISFHRSNFAGIAKVLKQENLDGCDLIFADLGVSSMQIDNPRRGMSYKREGPLDLRMDNRMRRTAADWLKTMSVAELAEALREMSWKDGDVEIGTRAGAEGITLILRCTAGPEAHAHLDAVEREARRILGHKIFGTGSADMAEAVGHLLRTHGLTVATAESCTGGLIAKRFTDIAGSSDYFQGGVVPYSNRAKVDLLGVDEELLQRHGAVSPEVAAAMARGAARRLHADCAVSTTGIAGPGGGSEEKPVGLVYIATAVRGEVETARYLMFRSRQEIRTRTAQTALDLLRLRLLQPDGATRGM